MPTWQRVCLVRFVVPEWLRGARAPQAREQQALETGWRTMWTYWISRIPRDIPPSPDSQKKAVILPDDDPQFVTIGAKPQKDVPTAPHSDVL